MMRLAGSGSTELAEVLALPTARQGVASNAPPYADETMKPTSESLSPSEDTL
jgi:hypothetical protein